MAATPAGVRIPTVESLLWHDTMLPRKGCDSRHVTPMYNRMISLGYAPGKILCSSHLAVRGESRVHDDQVAVLHYQAARRHVDQI